MDWKNVTLVSWDLDGTLYDREAFWTAFRSRVWAELRPGSFFRTLSELWLLRRYQGWVSRVRSEGGCVEKRPAFLSDDRAKRIINDWSTAAVRQAGPSSGLIEMMQALSVRGIRQVVVTDLDCGGKLQALGLPQCIEAVFEGENLGWIKPNPELFTWVLREVGLSSDRVIHIGDRSDTDKPAAESAGCKSMILGLDFSDYHSLMATLPPISG